MIRIGLFGAGRIGQIHARAVSAMDKVEIVAIHDPRDEAAAYIQALTGARRATLLEIVDDPQIDAVIIASPTDQHAEQILEAAQGGKHIFCEKPIDLNLAKVRECVAAVEKAGVKMMIGFNRRFDTNFDAVKRNIKNGEVGEVELVQITSRDPSAPPLDYLKSSGGIFIDMMIHDFDMARYVLDDEIVEVFATGSVLTDPEISKIGDLDTATATLRSASGKIVTITNSRRASYGYDQRVEVHGSKGMVRANNLRGTAVTLANKQGYRSDPLLDFFMERYALAYKAELQTFCRLVAGQDEAYPNQIDGLKAMELATAAAESFKKGRAIKIGK
ncbi:inositol 2-dehydrogenase [Cohaesibacter celericrescens]|uniref:Inositol 2-dehydrogenase n=1 Tax=Cohaesibacter celericrescens TaxID=2067669 RepID=A0A2N5XTK8_9HYPH|nr:inositol 2-dehydrogenase [Cohaesibacter celericrescens]PLW77829.1 inositol 2-dehydrogenase [Cohaesibacter celericrescens]